MGLLFERRQRKQVFGIRSGRRESTKAELSRGIATSYRPSERASCLGFAFFFSAVADRRLPAPLDHPALLLGSLYVQSDQNGNRVRTSAAAIAGSLATAVVCTREKQLKFTVVDCWWTIYERLASGGNPRNEPRRGENPIWCFAALEDVKRPDARLTRFGRSRAES